MVALRMSARTPAQHDLKSDASFWPIQADHVDRSLGHRRFRCMRSTDSGERDESGE